MLIIKPLLFRRKCGNSARVNVHHTEDVDVELFLNLFAGNRLEDAEQTESCVVNQGVDPAEPLNTVRNGRVNALSILHIQACDQYARQAGQFRIRRRLAHGGNDVPVVACKYLGRRLANTGGRSRDQNCFLHTPASSQAFGQKAIRRRWSTTANFNAPVAQ